MRVERAGVASMLAGLAVIAAVQVLAPARRPPVYDGVVVEEPYRYVSPTGAEAGNPFSYTGSEPVTGVGSPPLAAATSESPPQAQMIAQSGAFAIGATVAELRVSITPTAPDPPDSVIGNAYRFEVAASDGTAVTIPSGSFVTLALRAPTGSTGVTVVQLVTGTWQAQPTLDSGQPDVYLVNVAALGVFATQGAMVSTGILPDPLTRAIGIALAVGFVVLAVSLLWPRRRHGPPPAGARPAGIHGKRSSSRRRSGR